MPGATFAPSYICPRCLRAARRPFRPVLPQSRRLWLSASPHLRSAAAEPSSTSSARDPDKANASRDDKPSNGNEKPSNGNEPPRPEQDDKEPGAMSRRLETLTEEGLAGSGRAARRAAVADAGFSEELRRQLEERIAGATFKHEFARELAQAELPAAAGRGTREAAAAPAWTGTESVADASLRMLDDAVKPLRGPGRKGAAGNVVRAPARVDTGRGAGRRKDGARLADARDRTSLYGMQKEAAEGSEEREKLRREMRERFQPGARGGPMSVRALESLANERIEDAIARGQFKNIPRGRKIERDYNASNPFLDTTEYFMNKIIQKQEIVPPWIEKQQELVTAATRFRSRLRADWKRHAARMIASKGGSLETQIQRAQAYAEAEKMFNPRRAKEERMNAVDSGGLLSQITLAGELKVAPAPDDTKTAEGEQPEQITVTATPVGSADGATAPSPGGAEEVVAEVTVQNPPSTTSPPSSSSPVKPAPHPFRDPAWEATERSFLTLSVSSLNALTRSYNLMAPELAKKPYFSLDRELAAAFADVAPQLPKEIRDRALEPKAKPDRPRAGHARGGVLDQFGTKQGVEIWDETGSKYGLREFWRDLFAKK
ncbi:uncharacterized protein LTHEOB_11913 [Neofusicoccum parvum]|uniref:Uncharacterized protein LTHEOB_11913 n=1 Tax=Neofusicoccum parvum TaxID=310453 RepID=A0ACB5SJN7_9PEZI|nr:uncharacterized protein LTHEOB_11913 [Neofusicoccum parvum]